jgi:hypothetical protein
MLQGSLKTNPSPDVIVVVGALGRLYLLHSRIQLSHSAFKSLVCIGLSFSAPVFSLRIIINSEKKDKTFHKNRFSARSDSVLEAIG